MIVEVLTSHFFMIATMALSSGFLAYGRFKKNRTLLILGWVFIAACFLSASTIFVEYNSFLDEAMKELE